MRYLGLGCVVSITLFAAACTDKSVSHRQAEAPLATTQGKAQSPPANATKNGVLQRGLDKRPPSSVLDAASVVLRNTLNATVERKEALAKLPFYKLNLDIDYDLFTYAGHSSLSYLNQEKDSLNELVFLVYPNSEELGEKGTQNLAIKEVSVNAKKAAFTLNSSVLRIPLATPLKPGERVVVDMAFKGLIYRLEAGSDDLKKLAMEQLVQMIMGDGAKKGGYGVFSVAKGIVSLGLWYPILAAYDKDGWDLEPGSAVGDVSYFDVANYDVSVTAPDDVVVVTTGAETGRTVKDNRRQTQFSAGAVREFTIQMSRDYRSVSAVVDGVKVSSWYLAKHANSGRDILKYAKQALKLFNTEFGPYPYTELDVVEAPLVGGAGGVEFPGLVTVASMFYTDDVAGPDVDPVRQAMAENPFMKDTLEFVVAHEVAHEWWNAVVGSDSKTHPFVDEALANHSAIHYFRRIHGPKAAEKQIELQLKLPYQIALMTGSKDRPVDLPTKEFSSAMEYAAIVYGKGALFFDAMLRRFGESTHFSFFRKYYRQHAFGIASTRDLVDGLIQNSPDPAAARLLADRWLKGTHGKEDVGSIKVSSVLNHLLGPNMLRGPAKQLIELFDHKGTQEISKLLSKLISSEGSVTSDVDYGSIVQLVGDLLSKEHSEWGSIVKQVGSVLERNPKILDDKSDGRQIFKEIGKVIVGNDPTGRAVLDATDALLRLLVNESR